MDGVFCGAETSQSRRLAGLHRPIRLSPRDPHGPSVSGTPPPEKAGSSQTGNLRREGLAVPLAAPYPRGYTYSARNAALGSMRTTRLVADHTATAAVAAS